MITTIHGDIGTGKTSLLVSFLLPYLRGKNCKQSMRNAGKYVDALRDGGYGNLQLPQDNLVYADFLLGTKRMSITPNYIDGFKLGLPANGFNPDYIPPFSVVGFDEAVKYFDCNKQAPAEHICRYYEMHRHSDLSFIMASQRPVHIHKSIRSLAERVIWIEKKEHKYNHNVLVQTTWHCYVYSNSEALIRDLDSGGFALGKKEQFTHSGNIYKHYDSKNFRNLYLKDLENSNYAIDKLRRYGMSIGEVSNFNDKFKITAPQGFYAEKGKR